MANNQPQVPVKQLTIVSMSSTSISLRWTKATDVETPQSKLLYTVTWCKTPYVWDNNVRKIGERKYDNTSYVITGLTPNTSYDIILYVRDEGGYENTYARLTVTTPASSVTVKDTDAPKVGSKSLRVTKKTSNSISIAWEKATDNYTAAEKIRYQVGLINVDDPNRSWKTVADAQNIGSYTFTGLKANTTYAFYVKAYDEAGNKLQYPIDNGSMTAKTEAQGSSSTGSSSSGSSQTNDRKQAIRDHFKAIQSKDTIKDVSASSIAKPIKEYLVSGAQAMQLFNKECDISNPRDKFMPVNETDIFPGRLIYANTDLVNGKASTVDFYVPDQVGKVNVVVNFIAAGQSLSETDVPATYSKISDAISRILTRGLKSGALPPCEVESHSFMSNSKEKIAVDLGCSVDYLGAKCKIDTSTTKSQESFYQLEEFNQVFYKVSIEAANKDRVNFLGDGVTVAKLQEAERYAPIAIIKSVSYGRLGLNMKKYDASSFTFKGSQSASYQKNFEATAKEDIQRNSSTASHFARVWGGSASTAGAALTSGMSKSSSNDDKTIDAKFSQEMAKKMEVSMQNQGVPLSYTVEYLASGRELGAFLTGKYLESSYVPLVNRLSFQIKQGASVLRGTNTIHIALEYTYIKLDGNGNKIGTGSSYWEHYWSNSSEVNSVIQLPPNCYFKDNEVFIRLRSRRAASAGLNKWKKCSDGYVNITGGNLKLKLKGSYYSYNVRLEEGDTASGYACFK